MAETYRGRRITAVWNARQRHFDLRIGGQFVLWHTPPNVYAHGIGRNPEAKTAALAHLRQWIDMADERGAEAFGPAWGPYQDA
jgi:hypothetical protein